MNLENLLIGIILSLVGIMGLIDGISRRRKNKSDTFGFNIQYLFAGLGLLTIGLYMIIKELIS